MPETVWHTEVQYLPNEVQTEYKSDGQAAPNEPNPLLKLPNQTLRSSAQLKVVDHL